MMMMMMMVEQDEGSDKRETSCDEMSSSMEETSTSWSVLQQQTTVNVMEQLDKLEIDVSLQRREVAAEKQCGQYDSNQFVHVMSNNQSQSMVILLCGTSTGCTKQSIASVEKPRRITLTLSVLSK